jgi:hypothetical protein
MGIHCASPVFEALEGLRFPASKQKIISHACASGAREAVVIALNHLQEGVQYQNVSQVCENASIACSVEIYGLLQGLEYPADREAILAYAESKGASETAIGPLRQLPQRLRYGSIAEICGSVA